MSYPTTSATGRAAVLLVGLWLVVGSALAQRPVPPRATTLVSDFAGVLAPANEAALERKLVAYDDSTSTQIAVVIERTTDGQPAFDRSFEIADAWGIGGARDNGILLYVAVDDREVFIQTGYGVEDRVTDAFARQVVDQLIAPAFRGGRYYAGIDRATSAFIDALAGRYSADPRQRGGGGLSPVATLLLFVTAFFVLSWLLGRGADDDDGDDGGYYRGGRYRGPSRRRRGGMVILPGGGFGGGWGGGGGGFGGGGGGFGGFGGGGFGGGGAGGSW